MGASKSSLTGARDALLAERRPSLIHGLPHDALRHEIRLGGKALIIDIAPQDLRLAVAGRGARGPFGQVRGQLKILLHEQDARPARQCSRPAGECSDLFGLSFERCWQQVGGVAVPPTTPQTQEVAHDELRMIIELLKVRELGKDRVGADGMNDGVGCFASVEASEYLIDDRPQIRGRIGEHDAYRLATTYDKSMAWK